MAELAEKMQALEEAHAVLRNEFDGFEESTIKNRTSLRIDVSKIDKNLSSRMSMTEMKLSLLWDHFKSIDRDVQAMKEKKKSSSQEDEVPSGSGPRRLRRPERHEERRRSNRPTNHRNPLYRVPEEEPDDQ